MASDSYIVEPTGKHTHTVVFLHGRDSTASEFAPEFFERQAADERYFADIFPTLKWVFPTSDMRNSSRFEADVSQWFDIWSVENPAEKEDIQKQGLKER